MATLKTLSELSDYLGVPFKGGKSNAGSDIIYRLEFDSRKVCEGDLFICLTGHNTDGHTYAQMAYSHGCRAFLCERNPGLPSDAAYIIVENTRKTLSSLSAFFYDFPAEKLTVIGVTGTKGKTTTALLISGILNASGKNCAYVGSNGVIINGKHTETTNTTPESRDLHHYFDEMVRSGVKYAAIEVSSQALAHYRVDNVPFAVRLFLNLSPDHIGSGEHTDFEDYKHAKSLLFDNCPGTVIYNSDDVNSLDVIKGHSDNAKLISFGLSENSDYYGTGGTLYRDTTTLGIDYVCHTKYKRYNVRLRTPGGFSIYNSLAAIACAASLGVNEEEAVRALSGISVTGRFEVVPALAGRTFIIDYAHNGESLRKALITLREYNPTRLITVFGSVGSRTFVRRRELAEAASAYSDYSVITSDNPDTEDPEHVITDIVSYMSNDAEYITIPDREEAVRYTVRTSSPGDIVLFAGKGHETYQLINGKKEPFCERDIILDECAKTEAKGTI